VATYSIKFNDPDEDDTQYAMDWDFQERGAWTVTYRSIYSSAINWPHSGTFDDAAYKALLDHFGLWARRAELPLEYVRRMSPATLAFLSGANPTSDNIGSVLRALEVGEIESQVFPPESGLVTADDAVKYLDSAAPIIEQANDELIRYLAGHPEALYEVEPRIFEEIVAEILADMGAEVRLTPATRDGGRDILAVINTPLGHFLSIVECKRYAATRRIGEDVLRSLLFVMDRRDLASHSMLVTTSFFTRDALAFAKDFEWRLSLKDFEDLKTWLLQYGRWGEHKDYGLWRPRRAGKVVRTH
jgi:hypothetical protein